MTLTLRNIVRVLFSHTVESFLPLIHLMTLHVSTSAWAVEEKKLWTHPNSMALVAVSRPEKFIAATF